MFYDEDPTGLNARRLRAAGFGTYETELDLPQFLIVRPSKEVSHLYEFPHLPADIIVCNTAWFASAERDYDDQGKANAPLPSLRHVSSQSREHRPVIIVGHHPVGWFADREPFKSLLVDLGALYLHGHLHEPTAVCTGDRILSLGFGAVYQRSPDAVADPIYKNSFALCELHDADLHVQLHEWTPYGRWQHCLALPAEFHRASDRLANAYMFRVGSGASSSGQNTSTPDRREVSSIGIISVGTLQGNDWIVVVHQAGIAPHQASFRATPVSTGGFQLLSTGTSSEDAIRCIAAPGHVLSGGEIERANTEMDLQGFHTFTIVTLGQVSDEASALVVRLKQRKQIEVIHGHDLAVRLLGPEGSACRRLIENLDAGKIQVDVLLCGENQFVILRDRLSEASFLVLQREGAALPESDSTVVRLRAEWPEFATKQYGFSDSDAPQLTPSRTKFEREEYLKACFDEFNSVRYAALATMGLRFHEMPLESFYVDASADITVDKRAQATITQVIQDAFDGVDLEDALREQFEQHVLRASGLVAQGEGGGARHLYQQHGSLMVLGDPGSGKTCFVKNEILAYCMPIGGWYRHHIPVYVALSELSSMEDVRDLLDIASRLCVKRGIYLPVEELQKAFSSGQVAFFFDGIDEIVSVGQRARVIRSILAIMEEGMPKGNRYILTSRPAAVEMIELPPALTTVRLRGLTETEMRLLASRILALRVSGGRSGNLALAAPELGDGDRNLVEQIMHDCDNIPGVMRLARNPLLLTLLVMVYANSGPPSAKRHRIYGQAIQTLAAVRSRQTGQVVFAESDLKARLGALALSIFNDPIGTIPSLGRVVTTVVAEMTKTRGEQVSTDEGLLFLQTVAEATGLLVFQKRQDAEVLSSDVSFMHYSFLEYYAAVGVLANEPVGRLADLASHPRWREVVILAAGILADADDATALVEALLEKHEPVHEITLDMLLLAFECALEGEVPSERVIRRLLDATERAVSEGPAAIDSSLRAKLGDVLGLLAASVGMAAVVPFLMRGLNAVQPSTVASFADILGYCAKTLGEVEPGLKGAFDRVCESKDSRVRIEALSAIERAPCLRSAKAVDLIRTCLVSNARLRVAASRVVERSPGLAAEVWGPLVTAISDSDRGVSQAAARAVLKAGLVGSRYVGGARNNFTKALDTLQRTSDSGRAEYEHGRVPRDEVQNLLRDSAVNQRISGLKLLPWVSGEEQFVYDAIMNVVLNGTAEEIVASLNSLRLSWRASRLLRVRDTELIVSLLQRSQRRDVRIAVLRVLGTMTESADVLQKLTAFISNARGEELSEGLQALAIAGGDRPEVIRCVLTLLGDRFNNLSGAIRANADVIAVLRAAQRLDHIGPEDVVRRLESTVLDFKPDKKLRAEALLAYSRLARPTAARLRLVTDWMRNPPVVERGLIARAARNIIKNCSKRIEYVGDVYLVLPEFQKGLEESYFRVTTANTEHTAVPFAAMLRETIEEAVRLQRVYTDIVQGPAAP